MRTVKTKSEQGEKSWSKTNLALNKTTLKRLEDISTLSEENKAFVFRVIDMALRNLKAKQTYAS